MSIVSDLDVPACDYAGPDGTADRVEGIDDIDKLPIIWSGSPKVNPNHGPAPDV
jgi:hypothetical protein